MSNAGLFFVGAVLVVNGLMLLGVVPARGAAPLNLFVGALQVITPTYLLMTADDPAALHAATGLYLFGFTYLWVGINALAGLPGQGLGWFSLFVAVAAVGYAVVSLRDGAPVFAVIWSSWAVLWLLFFLVLGLGKDALAPFTGVVAVAEGVLTAAVPAWLLMVGSFAETAPVAVGGAVTAAVLLAAAYALTRPHALTRRAGSPSP
ncbi:AmiS/UreI family transporter [Tsukamurella sp. 1534]|uniref:AmiS/UreI family transporter n=1 Tax=Tsukamurella sp. 1534 TaxID=1151061 RepID=UPI0003009DA1|nr:AmiS/UreI family transporter [Tsukamurella sp. 1534]